MPEIEVGETKDSISESSIIDNSEIDVPRIETVTSDELISFQKHWADSVVKS